jgi:hypothetical protein
MMVTMVAGMRVELHQTASITRRFAAPERPKTFWYKNVVRKSLWISIAFQSGGGAISDLEIFLRLLPAPY